MKTEPQDDPYLGQFLDFLAKEIVMRPKAVRPIDLISAQRSEALVHGVEIDLDKPLPDADV